LWFATDRERLRAQENAFFRHTFQGRVIKKLSMANILDPRIYRTVDGGRVTRVNGLFRGQFTYFPQVKAAFSGK
jgi:hypothetical protein